MRREGQSAGCGRLPVQPVRVELLEEVLGPARVASILLVSASLKRTSPAHPWDQRAALASDFACPCAKQPGAN